MSPTAEHVFPLEFETREAWLQALANRVAPWFPADQRPPTVRIGVGFTSKGARSNRIGECWYPDSVRDGVPELFLHPALRDPQEVAATLLHELVHAALGPGAKHGPAFRRIAVGLGLTGKMTATVAGEDLKARLAPTLAALGPYPHAGLNPDAGRRVTSTGPKQGTRMLKVLCPDCGYTVRTTRVWLEVGTPRCPCGTDMAEAG